MLYVLKRHPLPVVAHFKFSLVLTYAFPKAALEPLLPPGLTLDAHGDYGFVAVALVQTAQLRPAFLPEVLGQDFFLAGYRIFARYVTPEGRHLRGLRILRSETDNALMMYSGNLLTHYDYQRVRVGVINTSQKLEVQVQHDDQTNLHVVVNRQLEDPSLPSGGVFADWHEARRFAGPLPYTFDYERETHSIIRIKGVRKGWSPKAVEAQVLENRFVHDPQRFGGATPLFSSAFLIENIPYRWEPGVRAALGHGATASHAIAEDE